MPIIKTREALDITFHVGTPGVPVQIRYQSKVFDDVTGEVFSQSIDVDSQASPADVQRYLGEALAIGRDEEQRALASERAAIARAERAESSLAKQDEDRA